jgi:hypothetical protein
MFGMSANWHLPVAGLSMQTKTVLAITPVDPSFRPFRSFASLSFDRHKSIDATPKHQNGAKTAIIRSTTLPVVTNFSCVSHHGHLRTAQQQNLEVGFRLGFSHKQAGNSWRLFSMVLFHGALLTPTSQLAVCTISGLLCSDTTAFP